MPSRCSTTLPTGRWRADRARSRIGYAVGHVRGGFDDYDVELIVTAAGEVSLVAAVGGARFAATAVRRDGDLLEVDGHVTIRGRTLAVTGSGTVADDADGCLGVVLGTVVDRRQFDPGWTPPGTDATEVAVHVDLTLVKETR
jgi:polyisoprenoid-binding protein YceI